jgi:hypothetical protein
VARFGRDLVLTFWVALFVGRLASNQAAAVLSASTAGLPDLCL